MDPSRISTCTYPVRLRDLDDTFQLMAQSGFAKVDLWGGPPNYASDPAECDPADLKQKADAYGLQIANLGTYPGRKFFEVGEDAELREMQRTIDIAHFLGSRSIRVSPGHDEDPATADAMVSFFQKSAAYAAEKNVFLGMENHAGSIAGHPDLVMKLVTAVDSPHFGILYEPANLMACGVDYRDAYEVFKGWITHVHVKDSHIVDGTYERTMLGEGDIDWSWVTTVLEGSGYTGDYALEFEIEDRYPIETHLPTWLERFQAIQPVSE